MNERGLIKENCTQESFNKDIIKEIIEALITRIMHDLINPIGSAQMACEQIKMGIESEQILDNCLNNAIEKLEIFRSLFKKSAEKKSVQANMELIKKYIANNNLDFTIETNLNMPILTFFLTQKMTSKSVIKFIDNEITLESIFLKEEEIDALSSKANSINSGNILPYLAWLYEKNISVEKENMNWKVFIGK